MPTSPDDDDLIVQLAAIGGELRRGFDRHAGMSQGRRHVLMLLGEHGELSQAELQRRMGVDGAAVTRLVKPLESEGLVARRLDPADNRFTLAALTTAGGRRVDELRATHDAFRDRVLEGVARGDRATAGRVLAQLRANLGALADGRAAADPETRARP